MEEPQDNPSRLAAIQRRIDTVTHGAKLPLALALAISISLVLTVISVAWYSLGGFSRFDFSRPGFERERSEVRRIEPPKSYDTTSPITKQSIDEFMKEYDTRVKELRSYGNFRDNALEDSDLQLN